MSRLVQTANCKRDFRAGWKILGVGVNSIVYPAIMDRSDGSVFEIALKASRVSLTIQETALKHEALVLQHLGPSPHFVQLHGYGRFPHFEYLALEKLGPTLDQLVKGKQPLPAYRVLDLAIQLIDGLAAMHSKDILHGDIKPGNIALSSTPLDHQENRPVYLDFGLARSLQTAEKQASSHIVGTTHWASLASHCHMPLTAGHDLEGLAYTLLFLLHGSLPWSEIRCKTPHLTNLAVAREKAQWTGSRLAQGHPAVFGTMLDHSRSMVASQKLDLSKIRAELERERLRLGKASTTGPRLHSLWHHCRNRDANYCRHEQMSSARAALQNGYDEPSMQSSGAGSNMLDNSLDDSDGGEWDHPQGERSSRLTLPLGAETALSSVPYLTDIDLYGTPACV
ncbi:kinase-like protein [Dacryopinax primogenitus]|uniref:Kinase-like protein n=1 Tax=Dacryopinax primogenitus (strain DJM 731) TaxID=1858805 RepID=M5G1K1_DACPD|nr:kinase-like protein [Dacryopinax primogenitus]EJU02090.1 kinase-like protein [Dacryopinax primogenitus]